MNVKESQATIDVSSITASSTVSRGAEIINGKDAVQSMKSANVVKKSADTAFVTTDQKSTSVYSKENDEEQNKYNRNDVEEMVEALESLTQTLQTKLSFSVDENTNNIVVQVKDKETDEVIKQFPPDELLELHEKMQNLTGMIFSTDV